MLEGKAKIKCASYRLYYNGKKSVEERVDIPICYDPADLDKYLLNPEPRIDVDYRKTETVVYPYPIWGVIWLEDGSWFEYIERSEGDQWEYFTTPEIYERLQNQRGGQTK